MILLPKPPVPVSMTAISHLELQLKSRREEVPVEAARRMLLENDRVMLETRREALDELAHIEYALRFLQHFVERR